ncbi:hypothetical protein [Nocardia fluminea]
MAPDISDDIETPSRRLPTVPDFDDPISPDEAIGSDAATLG